MQRLYVGGLSHTVTQKDLKDRFGKFGDVEDVELRIRRDTEGVPYKTFGYININISDANLKRCFSVLNKSKWKGGTLRIEIAKESFLQRLAEERQAAAELDLKRSSAEDERQKMLESLRGAGVENFTMRAAVPGTEVPGHENWVVSKFGRVLPILQLSQQKGIKVRPMKYDPSKYSHNIRRLDQSGLEPATPVTGLTWELQGGDSDISRKRRGEFPPFQAVAPKRSCTDDVKVNDRGRAKTRPNPPTADVADPVEDEDDFEVVGLDHVVKSARSCLLENDDEDEESSSSSSDSDYEAMFSNVPLMKISLADLQKLTEESQQASEAAAPGSLGPPSEEESPLQVERRVPKKGTTPEQILASILEDFRRDELKEKRMTKKTCTKMTLPPFRGTGALREEEGGREEGNKIQKLDSDAPQLDQRTMGETVGVQRNGEMEKNAESSEEDEEDDASGALKPLPDKNEDNIVLTQEPDKDAEKVAPPAHHSKASSSEEEEDEEEEEEDEDDSEEEEDNEEEEDDEEDDSEEEGEERDGEGNRAPVQMFKEDEEQQRKDNMRRLAAIQQRQKVTEEHKKVIQSALAKLDSSAPGAGKHIIFDSDEEDHGKNSAATPEGLASKKTLLEDSQSEDETPATGHNNVKPSAPQLFEGMEDEDSDDDTRFNIRPQFEGEAGHKLMELQSRFRTDERFRMDSRFLEDDEDKEGEKEKNGATTAGDGTLEEEKKKNLSILQSVLGSSQQSCTSTTGKAKTFRDVSALHYDPTREEHATLETRTTANKDSKSARRKKREEAEKLPEVSKEIYYDVSCDLKAVFGQKKDGTPEEEEKMNWDQKVEAEEENLPESLHPADPSVAPEESTGFQFSFFGDDAETGGPVGEYKIESICALKATRQPWQHDPQLNESSSEEEEEEEEEVPKDDGEQISTVEQSKEKTAAAQGEMFFFVQDDSRLTEGPRMFCCSSHLEEQKEQWEERRSALRMEYRKKHKEAKRKLRLSKKS